MTEVTSFPFSRTAALLSHAFNSLLFPRLLFSTMIVAELIAIPLIIGCLLGTKALAVLSIIFPIHFFWSILYSLTIRSLPVLIARARGENKYVQANRIFTTLLCITGILFILSCIIICFFLEELLSCFISDKQLLNLIADYYRVYVVVKPGHYFFRSITETFALDGRASFFSFHKVIQTVSGIFFLYFFIVVLDSGIKGIAYAEIVKYLLAYSWVLSHFFCKSRTIFFDFSHIFNFKENISFLLESAKLGLPLAGNFLANALCHSAINLIIASTIGVQGFAINTIVRVFFDVIYRVNWEICLVINIVCGFLFGERDFFGIKRIVIHAVKLSLIISGLISIIMCLFAGRFCSFFNLTDQTSVELTVNSIYIFSMYILLRPIFDIISYYLIAVKKELYSLYLLIVEPIFLVIAAYCLKNFFGFYSLWIGYVAGLVFSLGSLFFIISIKSSFFQKPIKEAIWYSFPLNERNMKTILIDVERQLCGDNKLILKVKYLVPLILEEIFIYIRTKLENYRRPVIVDLRLEKLSDNVSISLSCSGDALASIDMLKNPELLKFNEINQRILNSITSGITYDRVMYLNYIRLLPDKKETLFRFCFLLKKTEIKFLFDTIQNSLIEKDYSKETAGFLSLVIEEFCVFLEELNGAGGNLIHVTISIRKNNDFFFITIYDDGIEYDKELFSSSFLSNDLESLNRTLLHKLAKNGIYERVLNYNYLTLTTPIRNNNFVNKVR